MQVSRTRTILLEQLRECDYTYQEFLLSPDDFGIPNRRLRYFLLVRIARESSPRRMPRPDACLLDTGQAQTQALPRTALGRTAADLGAWRVACLHAGPAVQAARRLSRASGFARGAL